jgi:hypothetical protein
VAELDCLHPPVAASPTAVGDDASPLGSRSLTRPKQPAVHPFEPCSPTRCNGDNLVLQMCYQVNILMYEYMCMYEESSPSSAARHP